MRNPSGWMILVVVLAVPALVAAQTETANPETTPAVESETVNPFAEPQAETTPPEEEPVPAAALATEPADPFATVPSEPAAQVTSTPVVTAPETVTTSGPSGEDEGSPVPTAPPATEDESLEVQGVPSSPSGAVDEDASTYAADWAENLDDLPEDSPLLQLRAGPLVVAPVGMVQFLGVPWQGEMAQLANGGLVDEPGLRFRRVRIGFRGWGPYNIRFESISEFNENGAELLDLSMTFAPFEALELSAGAAKTPFSASMLTPAAFLTFLDRPWGVDGETTDGERVGIAPGRMLGVWLAGKWSVLRWQAGIYNGNHDLFIGNDNSGMLYGARVECLPLGDLPDGQLIVEDGDPRVRIGASYYFNDDAAGDTHGAQGDVKFRWKGLTVEGEFLWSTFALAADPTRPPDMAADISRWAYYAQVGYLVWDPWLDIAARFDSFELDDGVDDFNDRWTVSGAATLFFLRNRVKLQLEYAHHQEWSDPQIPNDSVALQLQGRF
jgi:hypothetical protein